MNSSKMSSPVLAVACFLAATPALAACNPFPYAKQHHVTIQEIEASSVTAEPGVELWVVMIPEGDAIDRCSANLGGTYRYDGTRVCVVPAP